MADQNPEHPISLMVINRTDDPILPYLGGHVRVGKRGRSRDVRESYTGGAPGTEVVLLKIEGGGHTWPAGLQYLGPGTVGYVSRNVNASEEIMGFFMEHRTQR